MYRFLWECRLIRKLSTKRLASTPREAFAYILGIRSGKIAIAAYWAVGIKSTLLRMPAASIWRSLSMDRNLDGNFGITVDRLLTRAAQKPRRAAQKPSGERSTKKQ